MKKILLGMMAAILVLTMAAGALAEEAGCGRGCMRGGSGVRRYVYADGDGVCDYCGRGGCGYYVDADGDGVCDNYNGGARGGAGRGRGGRR